MNRVLIFGGTSEGRRLCEFCAEHQIPAIYCVATEDGARAAAGLSGIDVRIGRLNAADMSGLDAELVIDATHPYATAVSQNIAASFKTVVRVARQSEDVSDCLSFADMRDIVSWLRTQKGNVFVTMGASAAVPLAEFRERIWLRILPSLESLRICLDAGYSPERLICMQGPFPVQMNRAMFEECGAGILLTKNSGAAGGFSEKLEAARELGMQIAVLAKPPESGVPLEDAFRRILEL